MLTKANVAGPLYEGNYYTHGLATHDLDNDGVIEVISAYCGGGEIIRYDIDENLSRIEERKVHQLSGSGEGSLIADVDNDNEVEYIAVNGFREGMGKVEIYEFDGSGELILPPRIVLDGYDGKRSFNASIVVGDVDNDGKKELIVGWKKTEIIDAATILGYRVDSVDNIVTPAYTFAYEKKDLDTGFFESSMVVADANNDGKNELVISTLGNTTLEKNYTSRHLGHVFMYKVVSEKEIKETLIVNFSKDAAWSSWLAIGDADNDGNNEIILTTGKGARNSKGTSYVLLLEKE